MLAPVFHGSFKKDYKLLKKQNKNIDKLAEIMNLLISELPLLPRHEDHPLHGNYRNWRECHVEPDWLLIYRVEKAGQRVVFYRTGSHSELF
jgi:mRNA interferase YafQ